MGAPEYYRLGRWELARYVEVPKLLLHERRQAGALGVVSRGIEERVQVRVDDPVEHAAFGVPRLIP